MSDSVYVFIRLDKVGKEKKRTELVLFVGTEKTVR